MIEISNITDFEQLYENYYVMLCVIAYEYVRDEVLAEEMVEETFLSLWEKKEKLNITTSIRSYLVKSVQNTCLQHLRKKKPNMLRLDNEDTHVHIPWGEDYPLGFLFDKELSDIIEKAISALPPQCKKIFSLSRLDELTYAQIAEQLNISENTVKTQMKTALSRLRSSLSSYLIS